MGSKRKTVVVLVVLAGVSATFWACGRQVATRMGGFPAAGAAAGAATRAGADRAVRFTFDGPAGADGLPKPWQSKVIAGKLQASVVDGPAAGERAIRVVCDRSHVVLACQAVPFAAADYPVVTWSWRADVLPARGDGRTHTALPLIGDNRNDKALQVMVVFDGNDVVNYVWDRNAPVGYEFQEFSPVATVKTHVLETGPARPGQWVAERVDVRADYARLFGHPPGQVIGVAVSANTNHTASLGDGAVGAIVARPADAGPSTGPVTP